MDKYTEFVNELKEYGEMQDAIELARTIHTKYTISVIGQVNFFSKYLNLYRNEETSTNLNKNSEAIYPYLYLETDERKKETIEAIRYDTLQLCDMLSTLHQSIKIFSKCDDELNNNYTGIIDYLVAYAFELVDKYWLRNTLNFRSMTTYLNRHIKYFQYRPDDTNIIKSVFYPVVIAESLLSDTTYDIRRKYYSCHSAHELKSLNKEIIREIISEIYDKFKNEIINYNLSYHDTKSIRNFLHWDRIKNENRDIKNVAVMYYKDSEYWAVNGKDMYTSDKADKKNLIDALELALKAANPNSTVCITTQAHHQQGKKEIYIVPLHNDVKCYFKHNYNWRKVSYIQYYNYHNKSTGKYNCSERKLISVLDSEKDKFKMCTLMQPCSKCSAAFRYLTSMGNYNFEIHCEEYDEEMDDLLNIPETDLYE